MYGDPVPFLRVMTTLYLFLVSSLPQSINAAMARAKSYHTMDAFVKLVVVLVRYSGDTTNVVTKINLLNKVCVMINRDGNTCACSCVKVLGVVSVLR